MKDVRLRFSRIRLIGVVGSRLVGHGFRPATAASMFQQTPDLLVWSMGCFVNKYSKFYNATDWRLFARRLTTGQKRAAAVPIPINWIARTYFCNQTTSAKSFLQLAFAVDDDRACVKTAPSSRRKGRPNCYSFCAQSLCCSIFSLVHTHRHECLLEETAAALVRAVPAATLCARTYRDTHGAAHGAAHSTTYGDTHPAAYCCSVASTD